MVFSTASTIIFVQIGFNCFSWSARGHLRAPGQFYTGLFPVARVLAFFTKITRLVAPVIIVRMLSNPDNETDSKRN